MRNRLAIFDLASRERARYHGAQVGRLFLPRRQMSYERLAAAGPAWGVPMLERIGLAACMVVLSVSSRALADTPRASDACFSSDVPALVRVLPQRSTRTLLPDGRAIPAGEEGTVTISGLGAPETQKEWQFRLFVSSRVVGISALGSADLSELHPTMVEHGASGTPKDAYTLHFVAPADGDTKLLDLRQKRSILVLACEGDAIGGWAVRPGVFAPPWPAKVLASFFILVIYFGAALVVYRRRRRASGEKDDDGKIYRIVKVDRWSFRRCLDPVAITADIFDRGSLPKFQILFFVLLVAWGLAYLAIWKGVLSDLSPSLIYLLGLPALGTLGSQLTSTSRDRLSAENWAWLVTRQVLPLNDPGRHGGPRWSDLVMSGTELDMPALQALAFSFIVGFSMLVTGPQGFGNFEVPATLLQILGLSQLVLVGGRLVKPKTLADVDNLIKELRDREAVLRKAASTRVDVDESGKPLEPAPTPKRSRAPADVDAAAKIVPMAVKRYRDTADQVEVLLEAMANRAVDSVRLKNFKLA